MHTQQEAQKDRPLAADSVGGFHCSHVQPHFLFNALSQIGAAIGPNPKAAKELVLCLADLLRAGIGHEEADLHSLDEEMDLVKSYAAIEQERFRGKLVIEIAAADGLAATLPAFSLVRLAEHLLRETLLPCGGGTLRISTGRRDGCVCCELSAVPQEGRPRQPYGSGDGALPPGIDGWLRRSSGSRLETAFRDGQLIKAWFTVPETTGRVGYDHENNDR